MAKNMTDKKKNVSRSQVTEMKTSEQVQPSKSVKALARAERKEPSKQESRSTVKRDARSGGSSSLAAPLRKNRFGRFIIEAYYELRHKVTWPTFIEARNMTLAVVAISVVIGGLLALLDMGLFRLFLLATGGK